MADNLLLASCFPVLMYCSSLHPALITHVSVPVSVVCPCSWLRSCDTMVVTRAQRISVARLNPLPMRKLISLIAACALLFYARAHAQNAPATDPSKDPGWALGHTRDI